MRLILVADLYTDKTSALLGTHEIARSYRGPVYFCRIEESRNSVRPGFFRALPRLSRGDFAELLEGGFEVFENNESIYLASKDLACQLLLAGDSGYISAAYENLSRAYSGIDLLGLFSHRRSG